MKILVIYVSAGAGHLKAAEAIFHGIKKYTGHDAVLVDALDYASPLFRKIYCSGYFFLISRLSWCWSFAFCLLDVRMLQPVIKKLRRIYNSFNARPLHYFLQREKFDCILSTHFMPNEIASALKESGRINSKIVTSVTDFDVHKIWLGECVDIYAVASDWTKEKLKRIGIDEEKIRVTGIPVDEKFLIQPDIGELKERLGVRKDIFTVLMATGSFGIGPIEKVINVLKEIQVIVVCGHNEGLFQKLNRQKKDLVKIFGLVDNMHELMAVSDVMVTKPGGLSISEALVSQLPMIFFHPIPGQETNNIKVLKSYGIGISDCSIEKIAVELNKFKSSKDAFLTAVKKTKELARPEAVKDILSLISFVKKRGTLFD